MADRNLTARRQWPLRLICPRDVIDHVIRLRKKQTGLPAGSGPGSGPGSELSHGDLLGPAETAAQNRYGTRTESVKGKRLLDPSSQDEMNRL